MSTWSVVLASGGIGIVASLSAVFVKDWIDKRRFLRDRRTVAYRQFGAAVSTFVTRADAWHAEKSGGQALADALIGTMPLSLLGIALAGLKIFRRIHREERPGDVSLLDLIRLIKTPDVHWRTDDRIEALWKSAEAIREAIFELEIVGEKSVVPFAMDLASACDAYVGEVKKPNVPFMSRATLKDRLAAVHQAQNRFAEAIRGADKTLRNR